MSTFFTYLFYSNSHCNVLEWTYDVDPKLITKSHPSGRYSYFREMNIRAVFDDGQNHDKAECDICSFRQYIKARIRHRTSPNDPWQEKQQNLKVYGADDCNKQPPSATWDFFQEDGCASTSCEGDLRYGHRDEDECRGGNYGNGCTYNAIDYPGVTSLLPQHGVKMTMILNGKIIDTFHEETRKSTNVKVTITGSVRLNGELGTLD